MPNTNSARVFLVLAYAMSAGTVTWAMGPPPEPNSPSHAPPFYRIVAKDPFDAGFQHGTLARDRIRVWFKTDEISRILVWAAGNGSKAFEQLKKDNTAEFPNYAEEMRGISEGAGVPMDHVWCASMVNDMENLMRTSKAPPPSSQPGCSDEYVVSKDGYAAGFAHGHNDDWSPEARKWFYFVSVSPSHGATNVDSCAGMVYPASLVGWSPTWNEHGMFSTQNTLDPNHSRPSGFATTFMQKRAICQARGMDDAISQLTKPGWSEGASMNVVDLHGKRMANIELWEDRHSVVEVTVAMGNYSHFNEYKHLKTADGQPVDDPASFATDPRQSRTDSLPAPRSALDIMARLSDDKIFHPERFATLVTMVLNGTTHQLDIWCCGVRATSAPNNPVYSFNLDSFFPDRIEPTMVV